MRITRNFAQGSVDDAVRTLDQDVVDMAHWLLPNEGVIVGSSSALNIWAARSVARNLPRGARVVTFLCDGGQRYQSRLFGHDWLAENNSARPSPRLMHFWDSAQPYCTAPAEQRQGLTSDRGILLLRTRHAWVASAHLIKSQLPTFVSQGVTS